MHIAEIFGSVHNPTEEYVYDATIEYDDFYIIRGNLYFLPGNGSRILADHFSANGDTMGEALDRFMKKLRKAIS